MTYSRFGAICELESAHVLAPQKPHCGATVSLKESRFEHISTGKELYTDNTTRALLRLERTMNSFCH